MKLTSKIMVALLVGSMSFGVVGCKGEPPVPPVAANEAMVASNGAKISVAAFNIEEPDFLDNSNRAVRPTEGQGKVAVLHLKIENPTDKDIAYKPLHFESVKNRIQLCTDPDPETGSRTDIKAVNFEGSNRYHTAGQLITSSETIPAGKSIIDEYLFEIPVVNEKLVLLVPGAIVGDSAEKVLRIYVDNPKEVAKPAPKTLNTPNEIDGVTVTVNRVVEEYAELLPANPPAKPLEYPYAYSKSPVMAVYITINNNSGHEISYDPQHAVETVTGLNMLFAGAPQPRVRIKDKDNINIFGKGQVKGKIAIPNNQTQTDVFYFTVPGSQGNLAFNLSGHILGVRGIYRFALNFNPSQPPEPDLKPYLNKAEEAADEDAADDANAEVAADDAKEAADDAKEAADDAKEEAKADEEKAE